MNIKQTIILLLALSTLQTCFSKPNNNSNFITYQLNPGRLGDHLLTYCIAKLVAHLSGLPLYYSPIKGADELALSKLETYHPPKSRRTILIEEYKDTAHLPLYFPRTGSKNRITRSIPTKETPIGYVCTLKTAIKNIKGFQDLYRYTQKNPAFKAELSRMINPLIPIEPLPLPENMISVAVHVRTGGGFDKPLFMQSDLTEKPKSTHYFADQMYPKRFPPEIYYIEQIATVARLCDYKPLFVHIFTDDKNPAAIVERFKDKLSRLIDADFITETDFLTQTSSLINPESLPETNSNFKTDPVIKTSSPRVTVLFSCRTEGNAHNANVLDDLFNMTRFDCLIRPASSYSKIAQLLGNHKIIIYPKRVHWIGNELVADKIGIVNNLSTDPTT